MKKLFFAAAAASIAISAPAFAETDGVLSTTSSTGTLDFQVNIPKMVRISGLDDLTINVTPALLTEPYFSREDVNDTFCVYSNDGANGAYSMTVTGGNAGAGGAPFSLSGAGGNLGYYMWSSDNPGNAFKNYLFGQTTTYASNGDGGPRRTTLDCSGAGDNANIHLGVTDADLIAAQAGSYTDTVTITVATI